MTEREIQMELVVQIVKAHPVRCEGCSLDGS